MIAPQCSQNVSDICLKLKLLERNFQIVRRIVCIRCQTNVRQYLTIVRHVWQTLALDQVWGTMLSLILSKKSDNSLKFCVTLCHQADHCLKWPCLANVCVLLSRLAKDAVVLWTSCFKQYRYIFTILVLNGLIFKCNHKKQFPIHHHVVFESFGHE